MVICHVSIQHIHPRRVMHGDNSRGVPNAGRGRQSRRAMESWKHIKWALVLSDTHNVNKKSWHPAQELKI